MTEKNTKDENFQFSYIQMSIDNRGYHRLGARQMYGTNGKYTYELYVTVFGKLDSGKFTDEVYDKFKKKYNFTKVTDDIYLCLKSYINNLPKIISQKNKNKFCILYNHKIFFSCDNIEEFKKEYIESSKYLQLTEYYPKKC